MHEKRKAEETSLGIGISGGETKVSGDVVGRDKVIYEVPVPVIAARHQLPPPPADFIGRDNELRELRRAIETVGVTISGLQGQGGVGKTALALKLAEEMAPRFPDAQVYLDLRGVTEKPLTPIEAMAYVIRTFHPEVKLPEKEAEMSGLYQSVLHGKRALLLMDSAKDATQVKLLIPPTGCAFLVTSRNHFALPGLQATNLDILPPTDAEALLLRIARRIGGEAKAIAKLCGYLPQALRMAATAVAERVDLAPAEYRKRLANEKNRLKILAGGDQSVEASINLSYGLLDSETQKRWRSLAVFPDTFDASAVAAVWKMENDATQDSLSRLTQYSMLEWNDTAKRYRLHDLMRDFGRQQLASPERHETALRHARHYWGLLVAADEFYLEGGEFLMQGLVLFDAEWGNIQAGQDWAAAHAATDPEAARLCSDYPERGAYCLSLRGHPRERIRWLEAALAGANTLKDRTAEGRHFGTLGLAYADLGQARRAIECYEQALLIARGIGDRRGEANALNNLGVAYADLGQTRRAIEYYELSIAIKQKIGDRRGEANTLGNLGNGYAVLRETRRAIDYHTRALMIDREMGDRRGEGQDLGNLGNAYADLGQMDRAIEYHEHSLAIARKIGHRWGEGAGLGGLGNAYSALGDTHRALEYYRLQLSITREIGDRRGEGDALWNKSTELDKLGDRRQAVKDAEAALNIFEEIEDPGAEKVKKKLDEWRSN